MTKEPGYGSLIKVWLPTSAGIAGEV